MRVPFEQIEHEEYTDARLDGKPFTGTAVQTLNGVIVEEVNFVEGVLHGTRKEFFSDGAARFSSNYWHGKAHGRCESYYANGQLESAAEYEHDVLIRQFDYSRNGERVGEYDGHKGVWTEWRLDGSLRKVTICDPAAESIYRSIKEERFYDADGKPTIVRTPAGWKSADRPES